MKNSKKKIVTTSSHILFGLVLSVLFLMTFVMAVVFVVQESYQVTPNTATDTSSPPLWRGQSFKVGASGPGGTFTISQVSLWFNVTDAGANYTILIQNNTGATLTPNGQNVSRGSILGAVMTNATLRQYNITMTPATLWANRNYTIIVFSNNTISDTESGPWILAPGTYSGGNLSNSANSGAAWSTGPNDMPFILYSGQEAVANITSSSYNVSALATSSQAFKSNLTLSSAYNISAVSLIYGGSSYTSTFNKTSTNNYTLTSPSIDVPADPTTVDWYWRLIFTNGTEYFTNINLQGISPIRFSTCESYPQNVTYINFTFKDEQTLNTLSATFSSVWSYFLGSGTVDKDYTFSNSSANPSYAFCFTPSTQTLNANPDIQYSATGYVLRTFSTSYNLSSSVTNQVLYLLNSSSGIYSSIQVSNQIGSPIPGAEVTVERQIGGTWTIIGQESTDSSGLVTFFLDPNADHRFTAVASGYSQAQVTIRPTQSTYTIVLAASTSNVSYQSQLEGIKWQFRPSVGIINSSQSINFNVTITASLDNLDNCLFRLVNTTSNISSTTSSCSGGSGFLTITYAPQKNEKITGILYIDVGNGLFALDSDAYWVAYPQNYSNYKNLKGFLVSLKDLNEFGQGVEQEFSKVVFFFIVLTLIIGFITYTTGYDFANPGAGIFLLFGLIAFASIAGWFQFDGLIKLSPIADSAAGLILDKYIYLTIVAFCFFGYILNNLRRDS